MTTTKKKPDPRPTYSIVVTAEEQKAIEALRKQYSKFIEIDLTKQQFMLRVVRSGIAEVAGRMITDSIQFEPEMSEQSDG